MAVDWPSRWRIVSNIYVEITYILFGMEGVHLEWVHMEWIHMEWIHMECNKFVTPIYMYVVMLFVVERLCVSLSECVIWTIKDI